MAGVARLARAALKAFWRESDTLTSGTKGDRAGGVMPRRMAWSNADNVVSGVWGDP
jgi:hypothetical protein